MSEVTPKARLHPLLAAVLAITAFGLLMLLLGGFRAEVPEPPSGQFTAEVRTLIDDYASHLAGWRWARDNGVIQPVRALCEQQHLLSSLAVEAVLADEAVTYVLFTVRGPDAGRASSYLGMESTINGKQVRGLSIGTTHHYGRYAVGLVAINALPEDEGELVLQLNAGLCQNGCRVTLSLSQPPVVPAVQTVALDKTAPLAAGTLTLNSLTVSPVQTVLRATWRGVAPSDSFGFRAEVPRLMQARMYTNEEPTQWGTRLLGEDGLEVARAFYSADLSPTQSVGYVPGRPLEVDYTMVFDGLPPSLAGVTTAVGALICTEQRTELPLVEGTYADAANVPVTLTEVTVDGAFVSATLVEDYDVRSQKPERTWLLLCSDGTIVKPTRVSEYRRITNWTGTRELTMTWRLARGTTAQAIVCPVCWPTVAVGDFGVGLK